MNSMLLVSLFLVVFLFPLTQGFDFFQLFEEAENAARQQKPRPASDRAEPEKGSKGQSARLAPQFCAGYACPGDNSKGSLCAATPSNCRCPFGYIKFPLQDWHACIRKDQIGKDFQLAPM